MTIDLDRLSPFAFAFGLFYYLSPVFIRACYPRTHSFSVFSYGLVVNNLENPII